MKYPLEKNLCSEAKIASERFFNLVRPSELWAHCWPMNAVFLHWDS